MDLSDQQEDGGTLSMWANMFGLGPLVQAATSPDFQRQMQQFVAAVIDTQARCERVERKLDFIIARLPSGVDPQTLPAELRANASGGFTAASSVTDDGNRRAPMRAIGRK